MPRTADELIAAATATGTYANYYGDGASVPWELVTPPANVLLFLYKRYLDSRWPQAFKLHDWCYTPLGALIAVTREEADNALFEIIARDSPSNAAIVYNAVRLGGGQYFGVSMTGFTPPSTHNIAQAVFRGDAMPTKIVIVMKVSVGGTTADARSAGFTESVWSSSDNLDTIKTLLAGDRGLLPLRADMLPASAAITGVRFYKGGGGRGSTFRVRFPGGGGATDIAQMALQCNGLSSTTGQVRRWALHAIPDANVINGVFVPLGGFGDKLNAYFTELTHYGFYSKPVSEVGFHINSIVAIPPVAPATVPSALVTTIEVHNFIVGQTVTVYSTALASGAKYTVTKLVATVAGPQQLTLPNWTAGNTTGGIIGSPLKSFDNFTREGLSYGNITTRKVGRPFDSYRGRRSKRRTKP